MCISPCYLCYLRIVKISVLLWASVRGKRHPSRSACRNKSTFLPQSPTLRATTRQTSSDCSSKTKQIRKPSQASRRGSQSWKPHHHPHQESTPAQQWRKDNQHLLWADGRMIRMQQSPYNLPRTPHQPSTGHRHARCVRARSEVKVPDDPIHSQATGNRGQHVCSPHPSHTESSASQSNNGRGQPRWPSQARLGRLTQTPEGRRRARYAGKVKRLTLEQGAVKDNLQVEYATGTLWYQTRRIASATAPPPQGQPAARCPLGWLDAEAVGNFTKKNKDTIVAAWNTLLEPLLQK